MPESLLVTIAVNPLRRVSPFTGIPFTSILSRLSKVRYAILPEKRSQAAVHAIKRIIKAENIIHLFVIFDIDTCLE